MKLKFAKSFEKALKKLSLNEQKIVANKLNIMCENPFYPSLRTKKVQGIEGVFESSVNMSMRILWQYENDCTILLIHIGSHSIFNKI